MNQTESAIEIVRQLNRACNTSEIRQAIHDVWRGSLSDPGYGLLPYYLLLGASRGIVAYHEASVRKGVAEPVLAELAKDVDLLNEVSKIAVEMSLVSGPSEALLIAATARQVSERLDSYRQRLFPSVTWPPYPPAPDSEDLPILAESLAPYASVIASLRSVYSRFLRQDVHSAVRSHSQAAHDGYRSLIAMLDLVLLAINSTHKLAPEGRQRLIALLSNEDISRTWASLASMVAALTEPEDLARFLEDQLPQLLNLEMRHRSIVGAERIR